MGVRLEEVVLVAAAAEIPEAVAKGPLRVVLASECLLQSLSGPAYVAGSAAAVKPLLTSLASKSLSPLGFFLDCPLSPEEGADGAPVELIEGLGEGFSATLWEEIVSRICARHLETVQEMIAGHARKNPEKLMFIYKDARWTYQQAMSLACSLGQVLEARGFTPEGGAVAVQLNASDMLGIVYLGLLCRGFVAHVVDGHPKSRAYKLSAYDSQLLLCNSDAEPLEEGNQMPILHVDKLTLASDMPLHSLPELSNSLEATMFVEYTSGSTGRPKAVATKQWRMAHWIRWREFHFPLVDYNDVVAVNLFFVWYWHITPSCGGTAVIYPNEMNYDVVELLKYVGQHRCEKIESITPGLLHAILSLELKLPPSLKVVVSGGEALPMSTCREWLERYPDVAFWNNLATTETAADLCFCHITPALLQTDMLFAPISAGVVCWNCKLDLHGEELVISGWNVADGYLPPTQSDRFTVSPDGRQNTYKSGDRARYIDGYLFMLGRQDSTTKIRGYRVDLAGLEAAMDSCPAIRDIAFVAFKESIWGTVVTDNLEGVKSFAEEHLEHSKLIVWQQWERLPYTLSAKRDRKEILRRLEEANAATTPGEMPAEEAPINEGEAQVMMAWQKVFGRVVGRNEKFGEIGGHSLLAMKLAKEVGLRPAEVFMYPTVASMAERLARGAQTEVLEPLQTPDLIKARTLSGGAENPQFADNSGNAVAIVGMSGRFPGAKSYFELWESLKAGLDMISDVPGAGPDDVPRKGMVADEGFDCNFWGIREEVAVMMDTTQRTLLELSYEAMEDAGFDPFNAPGRVGAVFSGSSLPHYQTEVLKIDLDASRRERPDEYFQLEIGVDKDYIATLAAYHLNLHGPAFSMGTACSSSLAATSQAVTLLRQYSAHYMLTGGASFSPDSPVRKVEGMIWSPDGVCRPFAQGANGTVGSDGGGLVLLTLLDAALTKGDWIFSTIRGCGVNNDGARKASFSAPSHEGQVEALRLAMADAGVTGADYDYVEAHGTGTRLGDPIEVWALTEALSTERKVALGSIKGNIGHLNTAAGICGLIKLSEMLWHQEMLPSRFADKPTALVDWESTPLVLATKAEPWQGRVAGVSSFGIGGTNVHLTLGASPVTGQEEAQPARTAHLFTTSSSALPSLQQTKEQLLEAAEDLPAIRVEATLLRRRRCKHRSFGLSLEELRSSPVVSTQRPVVLLFPGHAGAYAGCGSELVEESILDRTCEHAQPADALFASLALAAALKRQGLVVEGVLGYSSGEWAAAAFAGAISIADATSLAEACTRSRSASAPALLRVQAEAKKILATLDSVEASVVAQQSRRSTVLAVPKGSEGDIMQKLQGQGVGCELLEDEAAAAWLHCPLSVQEAPALQKALAALRIEAARVPLMSNATGTWCSNSAEDVKSALLAQAQSPVRFSDNLRALAQKFPSCLILEVGPSSLAELVAQEAATLGVDWLVTPTLKKGAEVSCYLRSLGALWAYSSSFQPKLPIGPTALCKLPSYSFNRSPLPVDKMSQAPHPASKGDSDPPAAAAGGAVAPAVRSQDPSKLFYESILEKVSLSCIDVKQATTILDGSDLPKGLAVETNVLSPADRAVNFSRNTKSALLYVGTSDAMPDAENDESQEELLASVTALISELVKLGESQRPAVFFILKKNVRYAGLCAFLRSAAKEHPELRLRRLILADVTAPVLFPSMPGEYELRSDGAYALRLRPCKPPRATAAEPRKWDCALVTGGCRGLGLKVAAWLAASGRASKLILVGRHHPTGKNAEEVATLQAIPGVEVEVCLADVSSWQDVLKLPPSCDLVIHAAGNVKDGLLLKHSKQDAAMVLRPKVRGAVHLLKKFPLARFLGFSSTSTVFGSAGQASYAYANAFLSAMMPTVYWGGWAGAGMAEDLDIAELPGEYFIPIHVGMECLGKVLDASTTASAAPIVLDCEWDAFRQNQTQFSADDPLLAQLADSSSAAGMPLLSPSTNLDGRAYRWDAILGPTAGRAFGTHSAWAVALQHVVDGVVVFPGSAFVTLCFEALREVLGKLNGVQLTNIRFLRPLHLSAPRRVRTLLLRSSDGASGTLQFTSVPVGEEGKEILHCTATYSSSSSTATPAETVSVPAGAVAVEGVYERFHAIGFHYGPAFQASCCISDGMVASGVLPRLESEAFLAPPAALDAALQVASFVHPRGCRGVPQALSKVTMYSLDKPWHRAVAQRAQGAAGVVDVHLLSESGQCMCTVEGIELSTLTAAPSFELQKRVFQEVELEDERGRWLMKGSLVQTLNLPDTTLNEEDDHEAFVMAVEARCLEDVQACRREALELASQKPCWVICPEAPMAAAAAAAAVEAGAQALFGAIEDIREVAASIELGPPRIVHACGGSRALEETLQEETPAQDESSLREMAPDEPFKVSVNPSMGVHGARVHEAQRQPPKEGEVEVRASIWALNFRDVLVAVGAIPMEVAGQTLGIGGECYGEVAAIGGGVTGLQVGDKVVALPPDGLGSYVTVDSRWVSLAPEGLSPEEAVAGTAVYATAWLGLIWQARICEGDRVLIHSAAGGVGLAAVHLCMRAGCEVFVTASTQEKRDFLLSLGVAGAFDSRSPADFEKGVMAATAGEGIDVVLNSLSGEAITASLRLLRAFGRFVEIGKRDQYEGTALSLSPFLGGLTYTAAHLDVLMLECPRRGRKLLEEVWRDLQALPKLPSRTFSIAALPQALEYFSKGTHIGKVLISITAATPARPPRPSSVVGPQGDALTLALRESLSLGASEASCSSRRSVVCIPDVAHVPSLADVGEAALVLAGSRAAAAVAAQLLPDTAVVELGAWDAPEGIDEWFGLKGRFFASEASLSSGGRDEQETGANLKEWLIEVVKDMAGPDVDMDQSFEDAGLDSLSLISLARRLSAKLGRSVSVVDIYDHPTPQQLLLALSGASASPEPPLQRPKVLCLHGFRSNKDAMQVRMAPFMRAVAAVLDWVFINSPRQASGPADPRLSGAAAFEWWGEVGGGFELAWQAKYEDGYRESLRALESMETWGVVGFSQGGSMAAAIAPSRGWCALFSAMLPPHFSSRCSTPSFHSWDATEEYVAQCQAVHSMFDDTVEVKLHHAGHEIPQEAAVVQSFSQFVAARHLSQLQKNDSSS